MVRLSPLSFERDAVLMSVPTVIKELLKKLFTFCSHPLKKALLAGFHPAATTFTLNELDINISPQENLKDELQNPILK
jgi:hypothetical protein